MLILIFFVVWSVPGIASGMAVRKLFNPHDPLTIGDTVIICILGAIGGWAAWLAVGVLLLWAFGTGEIRVKPRD